MRFPSAAHLSSAIQYPSFSELIYSCQYSVDEYLDAFENVERTIFGIGIESMSVNQRVDRRRLAQLRVWAGYLELQEEISPYQIGERCRVQLTVYAQTLERSIKTYETYGHCDKCLQVCLSALETLKLIMKGINVTSSRLS